MFQEQNILSHYDSQRMITGG